MATQATGLWERPLGAVPLDDGSVEFRVWAPSGEPTLVLADREHELAHAGEGVWEAAVRAGAGTDYRFRLNGREWPDPCSRFQPQGVRGPSRVIDTSAFSIAPGPHLPLEELVLYELHVGTFSAEGTFDGVIPYLRSLRELGVTAIELMPVATFPGDRGWGYDGVYAYAPHPAYGGPDSLRRLVDAAHREGLAVVLDVVYNHIGPGAEAIGAFGPYFTDRHSTFWGDALDYSQRGVREWAIGNALMWTREYRIDGLRLDAVHAVYDDSPTHVLRELRERVRGLLISEMGREDLRPLEEWGHDAMWLDSLHHHLHVLLTGEREGYYELFGSMDGLVRELTRERPERFVVSAQNHDQVGNRAVGDRLPPDAHRVALAVVLFSTCTPLVFMGEEYGERRPFQFFTDHIDPAIAEATRAGRRKEFESFSAFSGMAIPDPQDPATFEGSKLSHNEATGSCGSTLDLCRSTLSLRRRLPRDMSISAAGKVLTMRRSDATLVADFDNKTVELRT